MGALTGYFVLLSLHLCIRATDAATASSQSAATSVWAVKATAVPYNDPNDPNDPCEDDPGMDCADLNRTAHICTAFPNSDQTRKYCPKFCGLCGNGNQTPTSSAMTTSSSMHHVTGAPYNGPCKDDPKFDCADIDRTAKICTVFRDSEDTKKYCPRFCGLCGTAQATPPTTSVGSPASTSSSFTGPCVDAMGADCADLDRTAQICTVYRDSQNTKDLCPRYCHLCTPDPTVASTCRDADGVDCADLDHTAHICTTFRNSQSTREMCPRYCGLCSDGSSTNQTSTLPGSSTSRHHSHTTARHPTPTLASHGDATTRQTQLKTTPPTHPGSTSIIPKKTATSKHTEGTSTKPTETNTPTRPDSNSDKSTAKATPVPHTDRTTSINPTTSTTSTHAATAVPVSTTTPSLDQIFAMSFDRNDVDHDGILTLLDFEKLWSEQDVNGDQRVTITEYAAVSHFSKFITTELFQFIDHDHNGAITLQEVPRLFMEYDSNSDGVIDEGEFIAEFRRIYNFVKDHVK
ncbi:uncharacterized protein [Haliotis asinina]|uniref:uncharacterized protein isoform X2 n=1 Tax=Haliotis asinina TaxID=109174 RepID=UPI003531850C